MRWVRTAAAAAALLVLGTARPVRAEADLELRAAQQELKLAKAWLDSASRRYQGHRLEAIAHVRRALREVRLGLLDAAAAREHGRDGAHARPDASHPARPDRERRQ